MNKIQLAKLKEVVDQQLELRCINVETKLEIKEGPNVGKKIVVSSNNFQTIPVIHSNLSICDFGGSIAQDEKHKDVTNIWLSIHVQYEGNGTKLFDIVAFTRDDYPDELLIKNISHGSKL